MDLIKERFWVQKYPRGISKDIKIDQYTSIVHVFDIACRRFAVNKAFTNLGVSITYLDLQERSNAFASYLQNTLQLKKGDRIALQMPNLLQYPIAMLGSLKAGLVIVNTNPLYTEREMLHQFKDSGVKAIVICANFASHLAEIIGQTQIEHVIVTEIGDQLGFPKSLIVNSVIKYVKKMVPSFSLPKSVRFNDALAKGAKTKLQKVNMTLDDIAFLQYTGGTTGVAKGAVLTHRNVVANMEQMSLWTSPLLKDGQEVVIAALPLYHIFCLTVNGLGISKIGGENILITNPRDIGAMLKDMRSHNVTVVTGVNTLFNGMMNHPDFAKVNFRTLKVSVAGGMALQSAVATRWEHLTKSPLIEGFGLTEASPIVSCNPIDGSARAGTIGLPVPSTDIKLVDDEGTELVDPITSGAAGELCVKGPQVMQGYWQRPDETAKVIDAGGWLKTGDVATIDKDGFLKIVDRKKDMILVSGFNVYPNEIEDVISHLPGVGEVAAIGVTDGHSGEAVKLFIVKKDQALTEADVMKYARENLTGYKRPKHIEFRTELPKTNVGKILRRALRDEAQKK